MTGFRKLSPAGQLASAIGLCLLLFAVAFIYALVRFGDAFEAIEDSRAEGARRACEQRNSDRRIQRSNIKKAIADTKKITDEAIDRLDLNITKGERLADLRDDLEAIPILDCDAAVAQVRATSP